MNRVWRGLLVSSLLLSQPLLAQESGYVPSYKLPRGREIVAVYFGASTCGPCLLPSVKDAVRAMKPLLDGQAKQAHAAFSVIGVSTDWQTAKGSEFLAPLGLFDQVVVGGNWMNLAVEHLVWRDPKGSPALPQVLVFDRTVNPEGRTITFSEPNLLRRVTGSDSIVAWVAAGAPITDAKNP